MGRHPAEEHEAHGEEEGLKVLGNEKTFLRLRKEMVERQIRKRGIHDDRLLEAMGKVPRHLFVPDQQRERAYDDCPLPIGENQTISQPYIVALMTAHLDLRGNENVLELGTGSGYQTAILCEIAGKVLTMERIQSLATRADRLLASLGYLNYRVVVGDGTEGYPENAPFDRVIITAATPEIPPPLINQLSEGGVVVAPVGMQFEQDLLKAVKEGSKLKKTFLGGCRFVKLVGKYGFDQ